MRREFPFPSNRTSKPCPLCQTWQEGSAQEGSAQQGSQADPEEDYHPKKAEASEVQSESNGPG